MQIRDNGMSELPLFCVANGSSYAKYYEEGQQVHAYTLGQPHFWNCIWERFSFWTAGKKITFFAAFFGRIFFAGIWTYFLFYCFMKSFQLSGLVLKLVPCLLLTIFMTLLVRMLIEARERRQRLCQSASIPVGSITNFASTTNHFNNVSNNALSAAAASSNYASGPHGNGSISLNNNNANKSTQAERTTAMLTIIVAVFLITELPQGSRECFRNKKQPHFLRDSGSRDRNQSSGPLRNASPRKRPRLAFVVEFVR